MQQFPVQERDNPISLRIIRNFSGCRNSVGKEFLNRHTIGVAIGNFDGFHLGHQALLQRLDSELNEIEPEPNRSRAKVLMTFYPHPRVILAPQAARPQLLSSLRSKCRYLDSRKFGAFLNIRFNKSLSELSPQAFVEKFIVEALGAKLVVVGADWRFGKSRSGDVSTLSKLGEQFGFKVDPVELVAIDGERVSTTLVRNALGAGNLERVHQLLGRNFEIFGRVVRGQRLGRKLGYPTANLHCPNQYLPQDGIYVSRAEVNGCTHDAVTSVGFRPTVSGTTRVVETHLLDFNGKAFYSEKLALSFLYRIRDEQKFGSLEELKHAIARDIEVAKKVLRSGRAAN